MLSTSRLGGNSRPGSDWPHLQHHSATDSTTDLRLKAFLRVGNSMSLRAMVYSVGYNLLFCIPLSSSVGLAPINAQWEATPHSTNSANACATASTTDTTGRTSAR